MALDAAALRVFEAVARLGSMNRAAAELNTVQSNVTGRVRQLEAELGAPLFRRHSRGVALTGAGGRLLPYATRIEALLADARRAVADQGEPQGQLIVGSLETTAALRLAPLLAAFAWAHPQVDLNLRTGTTAELIEQVVGHSLEGAFVCGPVDHPELEAESIFREELALLSAPGIRRLEDLLSQARLKIIVLRSGCSYRRRLEEILARRGLLAPALLEFGTLESIFAAVGAGLGVTLLPRSLAGPVIAEGRVALHDLPPADARVETLFIRRRDGYLSSALTAFLACARASVRRADAAE